MHTSILQALQRSTGTRLRCMIGESRRMFIETSMEVTDIDTCMDHQGSLKSATGTSRRVPSTEVRGLDSVEKISFRRHG